MKIENPVGITTYVMSFLLAVTGLVTLATEVPAEVIGSVNLVLAALVALIAEVVRQIKIGE